MRWCDSPKPNGVSMGQPVTRNTLCYGGTGCDHGELKVNNVQKQRMDESRHEERKQSWNLVHLSKFS